MSEGAALRTVADRYERSPTARNACISHYGTACAVCGFEFGKTYGKVGEGLVVVDHLVPLGVTRAQHETVPIVDLRPVCANCHLVIHREDPPLSIEAVKAQLVGNR
jgi:predicted HNH restriction endonuclease